MNTSFEYLEACQPEQYAAAVQLIRAYLQFLNEDLDFQSVDAEMQHLTAMYSHESKGSLLLCRAVDGSYAGMVALRPKGTGICEMKRLYVLPEFLGYGVGKELSRRIISKAVELGYQTMVLDTLERLQPALKLYTSLGFQRIAAYYHNPLPGVVYMSLDLKSLLS